MKPHVISHILTTVDGRIDGSAITSAAAYREYEEIHKHFGGEAWLGNEATMLNHSTACDPFIADSSTPAGAQTIFVARRAESYAISVDLIGQRMWLSGEIEGDHLICLLSEQVSQDYLNLLRGQGISYLVAGKKDVDFRAILSKLSTHFGIHTLLLKGDSHTSRVAMQAGLVDEVSLLIAPVMNPSHGACSSTIDAKHFENNAVTLKLKFMEKRNHDILWLRYDVVRSHTGAGEVSTL